MEESHMTNLIENITLDLRYDITEEFDKKKYEQEICEGLVVCAEETEHMGMYLQDVVAHLNHLLSETVSKIAPLQYEYDLLSWMQSKLEKIDRESMIALSLVLEKDWRFVESETIGFEDDVNDAESELNTVKSQVAYIELWLEMIQQHLQDLESNVTLESSFLSGVSDYMHLQNSNLLKEVNTDALAGF